MANKNKKRKNEMLSQEIRHIIVDIFENINQALSLTYMLEVLKREYIQPEDMIRDAIQEGLIYVDAIKEDGTVYLGLGDYGESLWWQHHG